MNGSSGRVLVRDFVGGVQRGLAGEQVFQPLEVVGLIRVNDHSRNGTGVFGFPRSCGAFSFLRFAGQMPVAAGFASVKPDWNAAVLSFLSCGSLNRPESFLGGARRFEHGLSGRATVHVSFPVAVPASRFAFPNSGSSRPNSFNKLLRSESSSEERCIQ